MMTYRRAEPVVRNMCEAIKCLNYSILFFLNEVERSLVLLSNKMFEKENIP